MRLIDADALMPLFMEKANTMKDRHGVKLGEEWLLNYNDIKDVIDNAQPVEPQKIVTIPPELIEKLASCVVDIVGNIDWEKAIEAYKARPQGDVCYLCDGDNCPEEKASCKHGGPCRHTSNIEHAINFRRFHDTDKFFEVENVMRIEGQENQ